MNDTASLLLGITLAYALVDWYAVGQGRRTLELIFKPLTLVALICVAVTLDATDPTMRSWFVAGLVLSLAGDIFLLWPDRLFVPGLVSFLLGHIAYVAGFWAGGIEWSALVVGAAVVTIAVVTLGRHIVRSVKGGSEPELGIPVMAYLGVISLMVMSAIGFGEPRAIVGSLLFYASDALIAWNRFIQEYPWGRIAIIVTYHLGQIGLVSVLVV